MALQMATNITPDSLSGVGGAVFNAEEGLNVSWQVNGVSPMVAYSITLYANDDSSTEIYTTGKVTLDEPFNGVGYDGTVQFFHANEIGADTLAGAGITNGGTYKMMITQWWGATDAESVTQSSAAMIEGWTPPVLTMGEIPDPLDSRAHSFTATYSQAQGDTIAWVRWRVAVEGSENSPLLDTGNIYGTSQLRVDFDEFFTGTSYAVRCDVETNAGQEASTGWQTFAVQYPTIAPNGILDVSCRCDGSIGVNWSTARSIIGEANGSYEISDGKLNLSAGSTVTWNEANGEAMAFEAPWTVFWRGIPKKRNGGNLYEIETDSGTLAMRIAGDASHHATVTVLLAGSTIGTVSITDTVYMDRTWSVAVTADAVYVGYAEGQGGLYPGAALYPAETLYPAGNTSYQVSEWSAALNYAQTTISAVELLGSQTTDWLWIANESMSGANVSTVMNDVTYEPEFTGTSLFVASFTDDLNAGNLNTTGYTLYRQNVTTGAYQKIGEFGINELSVIDYAVRNNNGYIYQLWYTDAATFTSTPIESADITPFTWSYVLLACEKDSEGVYHVAKGYLFSCNVSTGDISNNNDPNIEKNFTRYPSWEQDAALYKTGTLKAYIGSIDRATNQYTGDTAQYLDELMGLSHTGYVLVLKDRRGDMTLIKPSGAITAKVEDKWPTQTVEVSIPWAEVGSADGMSIIVEAGDALWGQDGITETEVYIDPATGMLVWSGVADDYNGSTLSLTEAGYLAQTGAEYSSMENMQINGQQYLIAGT